WIWMMLLIFLAGALLMQLWSSSSTVDYGEFYQFADNDHLNKNIKRITSQGTDHLIVELNEDPAKVQDEDFKKDYEKLSDETRKKLNGRTKFSVERFHFNDPKEEELLYRLAKRQGSAEP